MKPETSPAQESEPDFDDGQIWRNERGAELLIGRDCGDGTRWFMLPSGAWQRMTPEKARRWIARERMQLQP